MAVNVMAISGVKRSTRRFLLAQNAQQVKSRLPLRDCLAFALSTAGFIAWGVLFLLLAG